MKIADVEVTKLGVEMDEERENARGSFDYRAAAIVQIETDTGIVGIGEGYGPNPHVVEQTVEQMFAPRLVGRNPLDVEQIWQDLVISEGYWDQKGHVIAAVSGIDIALWDVVGKYHDAPVHELLGGDTTPEGGPQVYVNDLFWDDPETMASLAEEYADRGFRGVKTHVGRSREADERRVGAIDDALPAETKLMVDVNCSYDRTEALRTGRMLEGYDVFWYEEPVTPYNVDGYAELRDQLDVPIAGGENEYTKWGFKELFARNAVDFAQPNIARCGGITEGKKLAALAETFDVSLAPHNFSTGVNLAATLQLAATTPACQWIEWDVTEYPLFTELLVGDVEMSSDGRVEIPTEPGIGVELPDSVVARYGIDE